MCFARRTKNSRCYCCHEQRLGLPCPLQLRVHVCREFGGVCAHCPPPTAHLVESRTIIKIIIHLLVPILRRSCSFFLSRHGKMEVGEPKIRISARPRLEQQKKKVKKEFKPTHTHSLLQRFCSYCCCSPSDLLTFDSSSNGLNWATGQEIFNIIFPPSSCSSSSWSCSSIPKSQAKIQRQQVTTHLGYWWGEGRRKKEEGCKGKCCFQWGNSNGIGVI